MTNQLQSVRVAFMVANEGIEQSELIGPWKAVMNEGGRPDLVAPKPGLAGTMHHLEKAGRFPVDRVTKDARVEDYDAVVLPGGVANPDLLRQDGPAVQFLVDMCAAGKPVAAICHGPWTLIEGGLVSGRTMTSWPSLQTDLRNAGATWVDEEVVVCREGSHPLITSRKPDDLWVFCREITNVFAETRLVHSNA
jgi:protease I